MTSNSCSVVVPEHVRPRQRFFPTSPHVFMITNTSIKSYAIPRSSHSSPMTFHSGSTSDTVILSTSDCCISKKFMKVILQRAIIISSVVYHLKVYTVPARHSTAGKYFWPHIPLIDQIEGIIHKYLTLIFFYYLCENKLATRR